MDARPHRIVLPLAFGALLSTLAAIVPTGFSDGAIVTARPATVPAVVDGTRSLSAMLAPGDIPGPASAPTRIDSI